MSHGKTNKFQQIIFHQQHIASNNKYSLNYHSNVKIKILKFLIGLREKHSYELSS